MATNVAPYEIIATPFIPYIAPVGEAFPDVDDAPAGNWVKMGTSDDGKNIDEDGVTFTLAQTVEQFRGNGSTLPLKFFRTEEDVTVKFNLVDLTLEMLSYAINGNTVTTVAAGSGTIGTKALQLYRGPNVTTHALLLRGPAASPYGNWNFQMQLPVVVTTAPLEIQINKGTPGRIAFEFMVASDPDASTEAEQAGKIIVQHAAAL